MSPESRKRHPSSRPTGRMDCPECRGSMDRGYLVAESLLGGAKWTARKTKLAAGGQRLVDPDGWGNVYLPGFRCSSCRILSLRY